MFLCAAGCVLQQQLVLYQQSSQLVLTRRLLRAVANLMSTSRRPLSAERKTKYSNLKATVDGLRFCLNTTIATPPAPILLLLQHLKRWIISTAILPLPLPPALPAPTAVPLPLPLLLLLLLLLLPQLLIPWRSRSSY